MLGRLYRSTRFKRVLAAVVVALLPYSALAADVTVPPKARCERLSLEFARATSHHRDGARLSRDVPISLPIPQPNHRASSRPRPACWSSPRSGSARATQSILRATTALARRGRIR